MCPGTTYARLFVAKRIITCKLVSIIQSFLISTQKSDHSSNYIFKAGFTTQIKVKSKVKKGNDAVHFLIRCQVSVQMRIKEYLVYVHLDQTSGILCLQNVTALLDVEVAANM